MAHSLYHVTELKNKGLKHTHVGQLFLEFLQWNTYVQCFDL